ncbi:Protein of unknown function [Cotesia congregata]|uniref:Uncharacterized protein n=1 Tax=Cotesia congregata TaxID=51543 RepID=A0A8J2HD94_COTCN|nr:Protein of unknown function [Cotesia congregata]
MQRILLLLSLMSMTRSKKIMGIILMIQCLRRLTPRKRSKRLRRKKKEKLRYR